MHVPPFIHCDGLHGSDSNWQFFPVYPEMKLNIEIEWLVVDFKSDLCTNNEDECRKFSEIWKFILY